MVRAFVVLAILLPALGGCMAHQARPRAIVEVMPAESAKGWQAIASADDQARIAAMPQRWASALAAVPARARPRLAAEKELVDPAAALEAPTLTPGSYWCRLLRFGGSAGFTAYPPDYCYVEAHGDRLAFTKQTGSTLPGGWIYPDGDKRQVFLGTFRQDKDERAPAYSGDAANDVAGVLERVAPMRWRLSLTRAGKGASLDVYELVPNPPEVPPAAKRAG